MQHSTVHQDVKHGKGAVRWIRSDAALVRGMGRGHLPLLSELEACSELVSCVTRTGVASSSNKLVVGRQGQLTPLEVEPDVRVVVDNPRTDDVAPRAGEHARGGLFRGELR